MNDLPVVFVSRAEYDRIVRQRDIMRDAVEGACSALAEAERLFRNCVEAHTTHAGQDAEHYCYMQRQALVKALGEAKK